MICTGHFLAESGCCGFCSTVLDGLPVVGAQEVLSQYASLPDDEIPLCRMALGIALIEYPDLSIKEELAEINLITEGARKRIKSAGDRSEAIKLLNNYFFNELGFRGNDDDYYNPRNSFLNEVLKRKTGIPITISAIYLEVAWELGLDVWGVGFPGHFLVGYRTASRIGYLDPFDGGRELDKAEMQGILDRIYPRKLLFDESFLSPMSKRMILVRILNNLRGIYIENMNLRKALEVLKSICILTPYSAPELREKGLLNYLLQNYEEALEDLARYVELSPEANDLDSIRGTIAHIRSIVGKWR